MEQRLFRVEVHIQGGPLPEDCLGAFVTGFLGASHILQAIKDVEDCLREDGYEPLWTSAAYELDLEESDFDTSEPGYPDNQDLERLLTDQRIWFGPFHTYNSDED